MLPFPPRRKKVYVHYDEKADYSKIRDVADRRSHRLFEKNPDLKQVSRPASSSYGGGQWRADEERAPASRGKPQHVHHVFILAKGVQELKTVDVTAWDGYW